ncbi:MAG: alkaline phosphatase family protein [Saprospiraceae bacterium]|nr:alkaline phosphatase family protein [Saprospiraceae bacterium]
MRKVIFYLIDGARPDIMKILIDQGKLPAIKEFFYDVCGMCLATTCLPSTTGPAYLPFLTGQHPAAHHITGIRWFDKQAYFEKSRWSRNAMRSYCGYEAKYFNDDMNPEYPSLFEEVSNGFNIYNMITKGVDPKFDVTRKEKTGLYFRAHFYHEHHPVDLLGSRKLLESLDQEFDFIFAVFPSVDWDSHTYHYADERTIRAYEIADQSISEVVNRLKEKGIYEDTLMILASDHGLSSTHTHFDLGSFFKNQGYRVLEYPAIATLYPNVAVFISGNSFASIHFLDQKEIYWKDQLLRNHGSVIERLLANDAIDFIIYRNNERSLVVHNKFGYALVEANPDGSFFYQQETFDVLGLGNSPLTLSRENSLETTIQTNYPDSLFQISQIMNSHRAGDFIVSAKPGYDLRDYWEIPEHKGSHGSLHKEHMLVPVFANKEGILPQYCRTSDLHPTIKNWLGIKGMIND